MATYTENYNLEKPAQSDLYNIDVFNENADKIDEALGDKAENQSLAPIESSATASRNYSVGQQFVYNGLLYEATSAIASGGTITPGSNCARTTVAEELKSLNDSLTNIGAFVSNNTTKTITAGTQTHLTDLCPLNLPAGSYVVVGTFLFNSAGRYYIETTGNYIPRVYSSAYDNKGYTGGSLAVVYKASVATTPTLGLYVLPDGTGDRTLSVNLWAVRIK